MSMKTTEVDFSTFSGLDVDFFGKCAVASSADGVVRILTVADGRLSQREELRCHGGPVTAAKFAEEGTAIFSADFTGLLVQWSKQGGLFQKKSERRVANGPVYDLAVTTHISGVVSVSCACDGGKVIKVEFTNGTETRVEEAVVGESSVLCVDSSLEAVVASDHDGRVHLIEQVGDSFGDSREIYAADCEITAVKMSKKSCFDRTFVAVGTETGVVVLEKRDGHFVENGSFPLSGAVGSLAWAVGGFSLSVVYDCDKLKVYEISESGTFEENDGVVVVGSNSNSR